MIVDLEIGLQVVVTWLSVQKIFIEYPNGAFASPGTLAVDNVDDVIRTAHVTEVLLDALAHAHSSVQRPRNDEYFVGARTPRPKVVRLADRLF